MPRIHTAHKFSEQQRTGDVLTDELVDFKSLLLSTDVLKGLSCSGFERPSPIQLKAIPLGRCGLDLIAQAKSGTGKTCVFSVIALESLSLESNTTQVLILAPTREIAVQIKDVITAIGSQMDNLVCHVFIGGLPVEDNKKLLKKPCHIVVGTPGRIKFLIENHLLKTDSVRLFILDEADKLLEDNFQEQINWIFSSLPSNKQMMAFSATYPEELAKHLTWYMREPTFVRLNATDLTLQGIKQFYQLVPFHPLPHKTFQEKVSKLLKLLSCAAFNQCLVFSNYQIRAQRLCDTLRLKGWPSVFIAGSQSQSQRLKAMEKLKEFKCRVLISTDLTSRGIDAEHVNLVVNMDVPRDHETYLHRIGRAGRFGTQGIAVTFVAKGEEEKLFKTMEKNIGITIDTLPDPIPQSLCTNDSFSSLASKPVPQYTATVEVDIMKNFSTKTSKHQANQESHRANKMQGSAGHLMDEVQQDAGKIGCIDVQRNARKDLENDTETLHNEEEFQDLQVKDDTDGDQPKSAHLVDLVTVAIQKKLPHECTSSSQQNQTLEEESFDVTMHLENGQNNYDMTQPKAYRNQTRDVAGEISEVGLVSDSACNDTDAAGKQMSPPKAVEKHSLSLVGKIDKEFLMKFQELNFDLHPGMQSLKTGCMPHSVTAGNNERLVLQTKYTASDELSPSSIEERNSFEIIAKGESSSSTFNGHKCGELCHSGAQGDDDNLLPLVEEFDRHFEEYLKNVCSLEHHVEESSTNSSNMEDDDSGDDGSKYCSEDEVEGIEVRSESFYEKSSGPWLSMPSHLVSRNTYFLHELKDNDGNSVSHVMDNGFQRSTAESSMLPHHVDAKFPSSCSQKLQNGLETSSFAVCGNHCSEPRKYKHGGCCPGHSGVNSNLYWSPYSYYNELYMHDSSYDHHYDGRYYGGACSTDWSYGGQSQSFLTSSLQCSEWNRSWYNAYQRQVNYIKQFVSLNRSAPGFGGKIK